MVGVILEASSSRSGEDADLEVIGEEFIKEGRSCGPDVTYADFVKEGADDTTIALFCRYHC